MMIYDDFKKPEASGAFNFERQAFLGDQNIENELSVPFTGIITFFTWKTFFIYFMKYSIIKESYT